MTFGIISISDDVMKPVSDITWPVLKSYADKHGYTLITEDKRLSARRIVWDKVVLSQLNLDRFDFTLMIDADVLITNHEIKLENIVDLAQAADVILATDANGHNWGVALLKNTPWTTAMLHLAWEYGNDPTTTSEQHALIMASEMLHGGSVVGVSQRIMNSYDWEAYGIADPENQEGNWEPGDFLIHLPGQTAQKRAEVFAQYLQRIIW